jgi:hypothetical protein
MDLNGTKLKNLIASFRIFVRLMKPIGKITL